MIAFYLTAAVLLASALGVLLARDPLRSALCLLLNLLSMSCLFAALDAHFLALIQVIVYAGAIMVLIMFALMLLNAKIELPRAGKSIYVWLGVFLAGLLAAGLLPLMASVSAIGPGFSKLQGTLLLMGQAVFTHYLFPFEFSAALIVAAIIGAVITAQRIKPFVSHKEEDDA